MLVDRREGELRDGLERRQAVEPVLEDRVHVAIGPGADREGAPSDHNFDTLAEIRTFHEHIDEMAGSGPDATNELMPEGDGPFPTLAERQQLSEWLACGSPD